MTIDCKVVICPNCNTKLTIDEENKNKKIECFFCGFVFLLKKLLILEETW